MPGGKAIESNFFKVNNVIVKNLYFFNGDQLTK